MEVVSPFTSIAHAAASTWNLKGGNQAAMDAVILEARTKANIAAESQPQERQQKGGKGKSGRYNGGQRGAASTHSTPQKKPNTAAGQGICYTFRDTGSCAFGMNCKFKHDTGQSSATKQYAPNVNANHTSIQEAVSQVQQQHEINMQEQHREWERRMVEMQQHHTQVLANMTQIAPQQVLFTEGDCSHINNTETENLSKVMPHRKARIKAPSEYDNLQRMHKESIPKVLPIPCTVGPIVDNAADDIILAASDSKHFSKIQTAPPVTVKTVVGSTTSSSRATMPVGTFEPLQGRVMSRANRSIAALDKLTEQGYTYVQLHRAAGLVKGDTVLECPQDGNMFRLPTGSTQSGRAAEMRLAEAKFRTFAQARARQQQHARFKCMHHPKCLICPDDACDLGNIQRKPATRNVQGTLPTGADKGLVLSIDYIVGMPASAAGNTGGLNVAEVEHNLGYVVPTKSRG